YCLFATSYRGDWRVLLRVPSVISAPLEPHQETALALDGRTVAGEPTQLSARIDGDKVRCNPGRESPVIRFRVSNAQGEGVPGVRVLFEAVGGLDGLSRQVGETNNQGDASVKAFCPAARVQGAAVSARVQRPELGPVSVPIEVRADAVSTIYIEADAANPQVVHDGAELRFSVSASDANGVQVLHPVGSDEPLLLGFGVASSGHAGTLLLGEVPILAQSLAVDEDGLIDLRLTVRSRATMDQPIRLRVQTLDGAVSAEQAIAVAPGAPSQLVLQPAGRVQALVGGVGGMLNLRVLDGDEINTANGVPGVAISISAPPQVRLGRNLGNTDAAGRFESMIILVDRPGDHTLTVRASQGEWSAEAELVVEGTTGVPQGIAVQLGGVILVPTGAQGEQPAHEVTLRTSEVLANTLSLRLVNDQGGGIPELGLTIEHIEGSEADCARWQAPGVTDEAGQVRYGAGQLTLTAGPRVTRCLYRISHGNSPASILMRIIQLPGKPLQAWLEPAQRRALANYGRRPSGWTDETSLAVTLRAVDSNQIPTEGFRMWLDVSNCWVSSRDFLLNDQGSATFRVAGGPDANAPCRLSPRYSDELDGFQPPLQRPILVLESGGYLAPQLVRIESDGTTDPQDAENGHSERSVFSRGQARGRWLIVANAATLQLPEPVRNGLCDPTQCTHLQLVQMRRSDHGDLTLDLDENGSPYILQDEIPLDLSLNEGRMTVYATISESWMGAARWLGLRLKQPGPEGAVSSAWGFFVHPGFGFSGPGHAGSGDRLDLLPPTGNGPVTLRDGRRVDLNDDGEDELLLCGTDEGGSWYAIVALDQDGGLPDQPVRGIRSWSGLGDQFPAQANRKYMCPVGDINNDGRLDLIMPTPSVEAMPTITIHQGIAGEQIF
ncbi:MAG: hypothetical protein OSB21_11875, partial [Myxococcota bacterium]|nr:hypothetical protein [Myxococcota bacterium]